jgi:hypothetical protein
MAFVYVGVCGAPLQPNNGKFSGDFCQVYSRPTPRPDADGVGRPNQSIIIAPLGRRFIAFRGPPRAVPNGACELVDRHFNRML